MKTIRRILARSRELRTGDGGGAIVVLAYATAAVAIIAGLVASLMANSAVAARAEVSRAATSAVRSTVDVVVADLNANGFASFAAKVDGAEDGYSPVEFVTNPTSTGRVAITSVSPHGDIDVTIKVTSTGRVKWERTGTATLRLMGATSVASGASGSGLRWQMPFTPAASGEPVAAVWTAVSIRTGS